MLNEFRKTQKTKAPKKVGLYTSPHLRFVRERIQINGKPLTEDEFATYFFQTWDRLEAFAAAMGADPRKPATKPVYFRFLTLMAYHTYLAESVDCAIIECGIGGAYDSTNIIPSPAVTGITSLGIDHVGVLGSTIEEIAWHKAGIMRPPATPNSTWLKCFTPISQATAAKEVLSHVANEKSAELIYIDIDPAIASGALPIGLSASFQKINASLALAISNSFLSSRGVETSTPDSEACIRKGLTSVSWPGRCDTRIDTTDPSISWHIDGGHTLESIQAAATWFGEQLQQSQLPSKSAAFSSSADHLKKKRRKTFLIFNQQTRDATSLATALYNTLATTVLNTPNPNTDSPALFDTVIFTTNTTYTMTGFSPDLMSSNIDTAAVSALTVQKQLADIWKKLDGNANVHVTRTIEDAVGLVRADSKSASISNDTNKEGKSTEENDVEEVEKVVLVTGSLHLVGGVLEVLEGQQLPTQIHS